MSTSTKPTNTDPKPSAEPDAYGTAQAPYKLYYWPFLLGRGEFVRLVMEAAGATYVNVTHQPADQGGGTGPLMSLLKGQGDGFAPLAPPILQAGELFLAQTANICLFLGQRHGLAPTDEGQRFFANQLQLTICDLVAEAHDTHHPITSALTYEEQQPEAKKRSAYFTDVRMGKFLSYFERVLHKNPHRGDGDAAYLIGDQLTYVDLSLYHLIEGLAYAFPRAFAAQRKHIPGLVALHAHVGALPRISDYLASDRRYPFNEHGIFRRYPELDI